jgi:hypothetical protein
MIHAEADIATLYDIDPMDKHRHGSKNVGGK